MAASKAKALSYAERATRYAQDIVSGRIESCSLVRLACDRHLSDLKRQKDKAWPYVWDADKGNLICQFAELMVHIKGKWAGKPIVLEDWQCFLLAVPFGWVRKADGLRRFREIYAEIPRKNAKSTMSAVIALYLAFADGESGAEGYSGATTRDQAMHVFQTAWLMVNTNPEFKRDLGLELGGTAQNPGPIYRLSDGSRFSPVVGQPGDGASPNVAVVDEYHEHSSPELYDTMKTGMGARTQPMLVVITTAGTDISSPCYDQHGRVVSVMKGTVQDEQLFAIVYGLDEDDDWQDFGCWRKANPNFGVSVFEEYLQAQHKEAMQSTSKQNINQTKHLNRWMNAGRSWMNMAQWRACARPDMRLEDFSGHRAWLGLDLASKVDMAALVAVIEVGPGEWATFSRAYLPSVTVDYPHNSHYRQWRDQGDLIVTDGARTDFQQVEEDAKEWARVLSVQELAFDPREASYLIQSIQVWCSFECVEIAQAAVHISEPMKELEGLVAAGKLLHPANPIFDWMMGNVVLKQTRLGPVKYFYPTKEREASKIDGPVALIMALKRAIAGDGYRPSTYETNDLRVF